MKLKRFWKKCENFTNDDFRLQTLKIRNMQSLFTLKDVKTITNYIAEIKRNTE